MDMTSTEELGLVWMGDMLLHSDPGGLMINSSMDPHRNTFFTEAQQTIDEMRQTTPMYVQDMNGFMMLDELEDPYFEDEDRDSKLDEGQPGYIPGLAGQITPTEVPQSNKKIKPIKRPGLKLQTPIAYQRDTDPNVIPIMKDGMAICEKCGAIGVKHAFYTKERRFCSLACSRGYSEGPPPPSDSDDETKPPLNPVQMEVDSAVKVKIHATLPPLPAPISLHEEETPFPPDKKSLPHLAGTYDWTEMLNDPNFTAASVSSFSHAPMANNWDNITVGMKVEVENTDCDNYSEDVPDSFWVATVMRISGYKALLRYEGFGQNESKDFWVNLCSSVVHPVGWCANRGKPLIPPKTIEDKYKDWKHFLVKRLTGARTLPSNFYSKVHENLKSRFRCDLNLEVVDKNRISQVKVATIKNIVGKRLHVKYYDAEPGDNGFWAHEDSPLIHPVGWARRVGQTLAAPPAYVDRCLKGLRDKDDATEDLFPLAHSLPYHTGFRHGMKLEAVDPLNLSSICVATIMKVLNEGYLMIRIDTYDEDCSSPGSDWFCYHSSSACILPPGFSALNGISLTPPKGYNPSTFSWADYLAETGSQPAPAELFDIEAPEHGFSVGQRLEAADLMDPRLVCVATVAQIVGRLIKVHFDGWEEEYDQWLDCQSPDMYPVGWCHLVSHKLEAPHVPPSKPSPQSKNKAENKQPGKRGRKPRRGYHRKNVTKTVEEKLADLSHQPIPGPEKESPSSLPVTLVSNTPNSQPTRPSGEVVDDIKDPDLEMGEVPIKDQTLPEEPRVEPPSVKVETPKLIPKLIDTSENVDLTKVTPSEWNEDDVAQFMIVNNCAAYCDRFTSKKIDGKTLLTLTKDQIIDLTGKKVGPSLKIFDLIQQLKIKVKPGQEKRIGMKKYF